MTSPSGRFHIAEIEDTNGIAVEWIVSDYLDEHDPISFANEQDAVKEFEALEEQYMRKD